jgi:16S rRNA (adenine1518-N6/adenine1519-N6)-dimethyltransferase
MLISERILDYEAAMLRPEGLVVLEIGGGTGNLTRRLAEKAAKVKVVERDMNFVEELVEKFGDDPKVEIVEGDFLSLKPEEVGKIDVVAGNIPYSISSPILFRLLEYDFDRALLCVQKEFGKRMVAKVGEENYSRLSVMTQYYFDPVYLKSVPKGAFRPMPAVDSAIILLKKKAVERNKKLEKFIEKLFSHKKNTLGAALKAREFESEEGLKRYVEDKLLKKKRVFDLTIDELLELSKLHG